MTTEIKPRDELGGPWRSYGKGKGVTVQDGSIVVIGDTEEQCREAVERVKKARKEGGP